MRADTVPDDLRSIATTILAARNEATLAPILDALNEALARARAAEDLPTIAANLRLLGWALAGSGRGAQAVELLLQSLRGSALLGDVASYGATFDDLVHVFAEVLTPYAHALDYQEDTLARLRILLERWIRFARPTRGDSSALFVGHDEVDAWLRGDLVLDTDAPLDSAAAPEVIQAALIARLRATPAHGAPLPIARVMQSLQLSALEVWILIILYCGQVDPVVRRIYTFAWNDFSQKTPDASFVAGLLFGAPRPIWGLVDALLAPQAPLLYFQLVEVQAAEGNVRRLHLTDSGLRLLQGIEGLSGELCAWCSIAPPQGPVEDAQDTELCRWLRTWRQRRGELVDQRLRVIARGASRGERHRVITHAAAAAGWSVLVADLAAVRHRPQEAVAAALGGLAREARLNDHVVLLEVPAAPQEEVPGQGGQVLAQALAQALPGFDGPVFLSAEPNADRYLPALANVLEIEVPLLPLDQQATLWQDALARLALPALPLSQLQSIAQRFPLDANAIEEACQELTLKHILGGGLTPESALAAAGRKARSALGGIAQRVSTTLGWGDVVLPEETMERIQEIVSFARYRNMVLDDWGFRAKLPYGRALSTLFWGPPGTGKTMMAGLIAHEIGMELFRVDLSQVVSKYIGETEKNLARIFDEATQNNAIILFDEADSLFAKRTKVSSSVDRYANLEVNFLLQRMESFEGVTILTTNFEASIDDAFKRRIRFKVHFPFPEATERAQLWEMMIPRAAATEDAIDFNKLGNAFEISGGLIRNAVLRAAFLAAERDKAIGFKELWEAGTREFKELGGLIRDA